MRHKLPFLLVSLLLITSCETSRYHIANDHAPVRKPRHDELTDAVPTAEKPSVQGNRPYTVRGKRYYPIQPIQGYSETGEASWYGSKFHGHLTANGEVYDMFKMTAAHKTLPLPSYIRVTNLNTSLSVVVRVNDRGPFHHKRVLDLSYAAAYKIGLTSTGVAPVKIELIDHDSWQGAAEPLSEQIAIAPQSAPKVAPQIVVIPKKPEPITQVDNQQSTQTAATQANTDQQQASVRVCSKLTPSAKPSHVIQLISTASLDKLQKLAATLPTVSTPSRTTQCFYEPFVSNNKTMYRLLLGPFESYAEAQAGQQQLQEHKIDTGFIRKM